MKKVFYLLTMLFMSTFVYATDVLRLTTEELADAWDENPAKAKKNYFGKPIIITGKIDRLAVDYFVLDVDGWFSGIAVKPKVPEVIADLSKEQEVSVKGVLKQGLMDTTDLVSATIVESIEVK